MGRLQGARGALGEPVRAVGFLGEQALAFRGHHGEQGQRRNSQGYQVRGEIQQQVNAQALHPRHGGYRLALAFALEYERRVDQVVRSEPALAHQLSREVAGTQAPHARTREGASGGFEAHRLSS